MNRHSGPSAPARIVAVSGNLTQPSKTATLVAFLAGEAARLSGAEVTLIEVADLLPDLGTCIYPSTATPALANALHTISTADALVVGSPTFKGSYTGLFKHLFDLLDTEALANKPVLIAATGGGQRHALMVEHLLRPLFGFFGAACAPLALYASAADFTDGALAPCPTKDRALQAAAHLAHMLTHTHSHNPAQG